MSLVLVLYLEEESLNRTFLVLDCLYVVVTGIVHTHILKKRSRKRSSFGEAVCRTS